MRLTAQKNTQKWILLAAIAVVLTACGKEEANKEEAASENKAEKNVVVLSVESQKNMDLQTEIVVEGALDQKLEIPGRVSADLNRSAKVSATLEGRIIQLIPDVGDRVSKGAVMGKVETPELLDRPLLLQAPVDGVVTGKSASVGELVEKGREVYTISDPSHLWLIGEVKERDIALVRVGQGVEFVVLSYPGETFRGKIARVSGDIEESSRTLEIRVEVDNRDRRLKPGMFADIRITTSILQNALLIDDAALQSEGEEEIVFVALDGTRFEKRTVKIGREQAGRVQILSGIKAGEKVVTEGSFTLKSEMLKGELGEE